MQPCKAPLSPYCYCHTELDYIKTAQKVANKLSALVTAILVHLIPLKTSAFLLIERT